MVRGAVVDMTLDIGDVIFVKTAKGQQEISARSFGLASRLRRALILVDGHKASRALAALLPGLEADTLLIELQAQGFIESRSGQRSRAAPAPVITPPPAPQFVRANPAPAPATRLAPAPASVVAPALMFPPVDEVIEVHDIGDVEEVEIRDVAPPPAIDTQMITQAQSLMTESATRFLGLMARPLIAEIEAITDAASLKRVIGRWNMSLRQSRKPPEQIDRYVLAVKTLVGI